MTNHGIGTVLHFLANLSLLFAILSMLYHVPRHFGSCGAWKLRLPEKGFGRRAVRGRDEECYRGMIEKSEY